MSVKKLEGVLDPKEFLEWGEKQLKKIEKERMHKSSHKEKQKKVTADEQETHDDQNEENVVKKKKKKKEKRKHETICINIEVNKRTSPKQKKDEQRHKRKRKEEEEKEKESCLSSMKKESKHENGNEGRQKSNESLLIDKSKKERKIKKKEYDDQNEEASPPKRKKTESDEENSSKKKKQKGTSDTVDSKEETPPKKKKRRIADVCNSEEGSSSYTDPSLGRKKKKKKKVKEHEENCIDHKKKGNDIEDVHSKCEESNSGKHKKKKKKKKKENCSDGEDQELETKKKKKSKLKEQVNTTENISDDIREKKNKKKKKDKSSATLKAHFENVDDKKTKRSERVCGQADDWNSCAVQCAPVCDFKCPRSSSGFGLSPISRLLSKTEVCDVCPGNVCRQTSHEPRPSETVNKAVVIKQERMEDWNEYVDKDAQPDAGVRSEKSNDSPLVIKNKKVDEGEKLAGAEVRETSNGRININIKQEKLCSHEKLQEESTNVQNENDGININIKQEKLCSHEKLREESTNVQNQNDGININIKQEKLYSHETLHEEFSLQNENHVELENVVQNREALEQDKHNNNNNNTTTIENDATYVNYYDDSFDFKDEFCNFSDPNANENNCNQGNAVAQQEKDYLHCVITENSFVRTPLLCTISTQGEERRVTSVDGERQMLHFINVFPKFKHGIQVSRILKVPLRLIYFHYYVVEGTRKFLDVYVKFDNQQNLKTTVQFYARRVRCENWCIKDEKDLPKEIEGDLDAGSDLDPYKRHAEEYANPTRHKSERWGRYYQHSNGRGRGAHVRRH